MKDTNSNHTHTSVPTLHNTTTPLMLYLCIAAVLPGTLASPWPVDTNWTDARTFGIQGRGWNESELPGPYSRLPSRAKGVVDGNTWRLARTAVGMHVDFETDATDVFVRYNFTGSAERGDYLWPINGHSGLDIYVLHQNTSTSSWRWAASSGNGCQKMSTTYAAHGSSYAACIIGMASGTSRQIRLYLPARGLLRSVEIGVPRTSAVQPIRRYLNAGANKQKPVVW